MAENDSQSPPPINPPPPTSPPPVTPPPDPAGQARTWNMLCHLSALVACWIPFGNIIGPLLVWQIKKHEIPSVEYHGKAAVNFQITATIAIIATATVAFVLSFFCIGYFLLPVPGLILVADLVLTIVAGIKANDGIDYKYPCSIDFIK